jgi:MFS family permease
MSQATIRASKLSIAGVYLFMFLLAVWPMVDLLSSAWPPQPGNLQWRYGFMGITAAFLHTPILAGLLAMVFAFLLGHTGALRFLSILAVAVALGFLIILILFPLDALQLRSVTPAERLPQFQVGAAIVELKHLTALVTLLLLGVGGWRTAGSLAKRTKSPEGSQLTAEVLKAQKRD